jgi:hypothetical protein
LALVNLRLDLRLLGKHSSSPLSLGARRGARLLATIVERLNPFVP